MVLMDDVTAARIWDCIASLSTFEGWLCVISRSEFGGWSLASLRICLGAALFRSWERWWGIRLRRRRLLTRQQDTSDLEKDSNCHLMSDLVEVQQKINPHKVNVSFLFCNSSLLVTRRLWRGFICFIYPIELHRRLRSFDFSLMELMSMVMTFRNESPVWRLFIR